MVSDYYKVENLGLRLISLILKIVLAFSFPDIYLIIVQNRRLR